MQVPTMRVPTVRGIIDRRLLVNFRIDPSIMAGVLPPPFRPKLVNGYGIGGICLIRLKEIRPRFSPLPFGLRSENAAHRFAVEWDDNGQLREGVYIPRRDTNSLLSTLIGGRLFPGIHHRASFNVNESNDYFSVTLCSEDDNTNVHVSGKVTDDIPYSSVFSSLAEASAFFERGALGYSATYNEHQYDGLELSCVNWSVEPIKISRVRSSYFGDESRWPPGSVEFDCALLMRGIEHEWLSRDKLCAN